MKKILALSGPKGSGKSTVAKTLLNKNPLVANATILSFADPLKKMASLLLPPEAFLPENKESLEFGLCGKTPRHILQTLGTEWGRIHIGENIWAEHMEKRLLQSKDPVIIDDLRFENEAQMLLLFPICRIIQIQRKGYFPKDSHASEEGLPTHLLHGKLENSDLKDLQKICTSWDPWSDCPPTPKNT